MARLRGHSVRLRDSLTESGGRRARSCAPHIDQGEDMVCTRSLVVSVLATVLAGCGTSPATAPSNAGVGPIGSATSTSDLVFATALKDAHDANADPAQIQQLEEARGEGEVSFGMLVEAYGNEIACVEDAGIPVVSPRTYEARGVEWYTYGTRVPVTMTDAVQGAITWDCAEKHRAFIEYVYSNQPSTTEAFDTALAAALPDIRSCLVREGVADAAVMDQNEAFTASMHLYDEQAAAGNASPKDCVADAGVNW